MVEWHHRRNGHEFEQVLGVDDGQGSLAWCSQWGHKESETEQLHSTAISPEKLPQNFLWFSGKALY